MKAEKKQKKEGVEVMHWRGPVFNMVAKEDLIKMGTYDTDLKD